MAHILNGFLTPDSDGDELIQAPISSHSSPAVRQSSAQDHEGQPLVRTTSEGIVSDVDTASTVLEQRDDGPNSESERHDNYGGVQAVQPRNLSSRLRIHDPYILSYLIKKTGEITENLLKDWSVRKAVILAIVFITLYKVCTTLIYALQVDEVIVY